MKKNHPRGKNLLCSSRFAAFTILLFSAFFAKAQTIKHIKWTEMAKNRNATFYDVKRDFESKWKGTLREMARDRRKTTGLAKKVTKTVAGYEIYKRWEHFMAPRVYPSGDLTLPSTNYQNFTNWAKTRLAAPAKPKLLASSMSVPLSAAGNVSGNWTLLGPIGVPSGGNSGAGRVNFLRFLPGNSNTMFIGTPDGGLWKSTDAGTNWTTNTDFLGVIGCSDLTIDATNTNNMYLATGDLEGDRSSIGILKSTDGGATWTATALTFLPSDGVTISRLLMDPSNPLIQLAATSNGVYRTSDGWATSAQTEVGDSFKDMKFKPGDPNTVYVAGTIISKSTDKGLTWTQVTSGLPSEASVVRIALAVTPGNTGYVYAIIGKASDNSLLGVYRSTNSGASFSLRSSSPNILGSNADGSDTTYGQAFYDLAIVASATNAELVIVGGINQWQSADGGTTWTNKTAWDANNAVVHADVHDIEYLPGSSNTIFSCNDGGIFESTDNATTWTNISHNLAISQVVGIGLSASVATTLVDGEQDNGTNLKIGSAWHNIFGGDGGQCFIDYTNDNTIYAQYVQGDFERSDDGGVTFNPIQTGLPATGDTGVFDFYSAWHEDPVNAAKLYVAGTPRLYSSVNKGASWTGLGTPPGTGSITEFVVAPSNTAIIYAVKQNAVSKSTNSGASFTNITGTLPSTAAFANVTVSNTNPNIVWVIYSGYSASNKVYKSVDGGTSWTNMSAGLPNLPMNTIVHVDGSSTDALYLGADIGAYYFDNTLSSWKPFMTNLPNNSVRALKIYYPTGKIRAATYGRGVWESDLHGVATASTDATLANIAISSGVLTPAFASATNSYTAAVSNSIASVTVTPTTNNANATVKVNGVMVTSGSASSAITLAVGSNTISIVATAQDGTTSQTYTLTITRAPSSNSSLATLSISSGSLSPSFTAGTLSYTAGVTNVTTSITLTPTTADPNATVTVNGVSVVSGAASQAVALSVSSPVTIPVVVHGTGGTQTTYTVTVTRLSNNANLAGLTISSGTLAPVFVYSTVAYTTSLGNAVTSITLKPTASDPKATITVNGTAVASGTVSAAIALKGGVNNIYIQLHAQDGTQKTYSLAVTRPLSTNANLANIVLSSGAYSPTFASSIVSYTATVSNATKSITLTPTTSDISATVTVNGVAVTSGKPSGPVPLGVGSNAVHAVVHAQNGTQRTYTITITRLSNDANLASLVISSGTLTPAFTISNAIYTASVSNAVTSLTLTPTTEEAHATVAVNGVAVTSGIASSAIALVVGTNTIRAVVHAQDGTQKTYTVTVTRAVAGMASIFNFSQNSELTPLVTNISNAKVEANNILSPNGDGINDIWIVKNIAFYPNNSVSVYDQSGKVVFTSKNYQNDWYGSYRGTVVNQGTYYYLIDLGNGSQIKGYITVLRDK